MRNTIPFDTHAYVKKLVAAGAPERQAEVHAEAMAELVFERLATKEDLRTGLQALELRLTLRFGVMLAAAVAITTALVKLL
jgi:hypothetical protein